MTERKPAYRVVIIEWPKSCAWSWSIVDAANHYAICDAACDSQSRDAARAAARRLLDAIRAGDVDETEIGR